MSTSWLNGAFLKNIFQIISLSQASGIGYISFRLSALDYEGLRFAVSQGRIEWQRHALERMGERGILRSAVKDTLLTGEII